MTETSHNRAERDDSFAKWLEADRSVTEAYGKQIFEARKLASDFSKVVITNLLFINSASLLGVPTLARTLGVTASTRVDKLLFIGLPMMLFIVGFLCAAFSALLGYYHWQRQSQLARAEMEERRCEVMAAYELSLSNDGKEPRACETEGVKRSTIEAAIARNYRRGHNLGWASAANFIGGCSWLAITWH